MLVISSRYISMSCDRSSVVVVPSGHFWQRAAPHGGIFARDDGPRADLAGDQTAGGNFQVCLRPADGVLGREARNAVRAVLLIVRRIS
jgi:hypothetical protein